MISAHKHHTIPLLVTSHCRCSTRAKNVALVSRSFVRLASGSGSSSNSNSGTSWGAYQLRAGAVAGAAVAIALGAPSSTYLRCVSRPLYSVASSLPRHSPPPFIIIFFVSLLVKEKWSGILCPLCGGVLAEPLSRELHATATWQHVAHKEATGEVDFILAKRDYGSPASIPGDQIIRHQDSQSFFDSRTRRGVQLSRHDTAKIGHYPHLFDVYCCVRWVGGMFGLFRWHRSRGEKSDGRQDALINWHLGQDELKSNCFSLLVLFFNPEACQHYATYFSELTVNRMTSGNEIEWPQKRKYGLGYDARPSNDSFASFRRLSRRRDRGAPLRQPSTGCRLLISQKESEEKNSKKEGRSIAEQWLLFHCLRGPRFTAKEEVGWLTQ